MLKGKVVLIVDDYDKIEAVTEVYLCAARCRTHRHYAGAPVLDWMARNPADLVLLDLMLPGRDGLSVCRDIRKSSAVPVIMITARREASDRLAGF